MLFEVDLRTYRKYFPSNPHPFISESFIELNKCKVERIIRLVDGIERASIGIIAGVKNGVLYSPFSAPFGGFHFRNEIIYVHEIDNFLVSMKNFITENGFTGVEITLPPDIYHMTFNAKAINSLIRNEFKTGPPEITNWVNLQSFVGTFTQKNSREYYRQAVRNDLFFHVVADLVEKKRIYELICANRAKFGRPIYMTFEDLIDTGNLWPIDFIKIDNSDKEIIASAIFYRSLPDICFAVFWGDNDIGRPLRAMDFLTFNLWSYYKDMGFKYIDLGISTEAGIPNEGLLRFKESHESVSSLKYKFVWAPMPGNL
jgi:hypothetical protein